MIPLLVVAAVLTIVACMAAVYALAQWRAATTLLAMQGDVLAAERLTHTAQLDALARMMHSAVGVAAFGGTPRAATVTPQPPDAEARMQRRVREETIAGGATAIMADYRAAGMTITEGEAREQAIAFLGGDVTSVFGDPR